jgi:hypothetical protein
VKDILAQVGMKGVAAVAAMNRATTAILIPTSAAQLHLVLPQQGPQFDGELPASVRDAG